MAAECVGGAEHRRGPERGIDRRVLIRRAAVVGAAAWTAPLVVGSIASPAGAGTYHGCYRVQFERNTGGTTCSSFSRVVPDNGAGCLDPNNWNNLPNYPGTVTLSASGTAPSCTYTIALAPGSNCVLDKRSVARKDQGNSCATGTAGSGCQSITIATSFLPDRFKVLISCDDVVCPGGTAC